MKRVSGMFAAKMWGIQFGALCLVLSACASPVETPSGLGDCGGAIATGAALQAPTEAPKNFAERVTTRVREGQAAGRVGLIAREVAFSRAIDDDAAANGTSADGRQLAQRARIVMMEDNGSPGAQSPEYRHLADSVSKYPGVMARVNATRSMVARATNFLAFWKSHKGAKTIVDSGYDSVEVVATMVDVANTAGTLDSVGVMTGSIYSTESTDASAFGIGPIDSAALLNVAIDGDHTLNSAEGWALDAWIHGWDGPLYSLTNPGCSSGITITHPTRASVQACPILRCLAAAAGAMAAVIRGVTSRYVAKEAQTVAAIVEDLTAYVLEVGWEAIIVQTIALLAPLAEREMPGDVTVHR